MNKSILKNFIYIAIIALIILSGSLNRAYASENISRFIPGDAFVYLNCDFNPDKWEVATRNRIFSEWEIFPPIKDFVQKLEKETGLKVDEQLLYKSEQLGFAVSMPNVNSLMNMEPYIIGVIKLKDKDTANSLLTTMLSSYETNKGVKLPLSEKYNNIPIYKFEDSNKAAFYLVSYNNYFLVCNNDTFLKDCFAVYGKTKEGLEDSPIFTKTYAKSGEDKVLWFYLNSESILAKLAPLVTLMSGNSSELDAFKMYKSLGVGAGLADNGIEIKTYMVINANDPVAKVFTTKSSSFELPLKLTPPNPYFYFSVIGIKDTFKYLDQSQEWCSFKNDLYDETGLDLNIFTKILSQSDEVAINCYKAIAQEKEKFTFSNLTLFFKIKDKAGADNTLKQLKIRAKDNKYIKVGEWLKYRNRKITVFNRIKQTEGMNFRPAYTFLGDYLVLGVYPGSLMRAIDLYDKVIPSLSQNSNFNDIMMRLGTQKLTSVGYSDCSEVRAALKGMPGMNFLVPYFEIFRRIGLNSQIDGKDGATGTLLIDLDWDKVDIGHLFGIVN